ncbi:general substrate transporter [Testicularia cyperi]|uniref:General substrate transporter n=1 Tax=Testicularia cyperi TaxID=1882483 RepID=A0A317Y2B8_9BASI|nr:general substrate transporter [Testicularia cyperi]
MVFQEGQDVARIDSKAAAAIASKVEDYDALVHDAAEATKAQENMSLKQALRTYPRAIGFSLILSLAVVMEGYDTMLLGNFFAQPAFARKYGNCSEITGECEIPAKWQTGLMNGSQVGSIIGLQITGIASERFGYRPTILVALILMTAFIFIPFFAPNLEILLLGQVLQGLPWGCFQTLTTAYAAEVTPVALRPFLTTWVNACWVIGQLVATGVLRATVNRTDHWAYKIPYALQWIWPVPIFIGCIFAPESPWWLVRQNRLEDAKKSLKRLAANDREFTDHEANQTVQMMIHTNELEKAAAEGGSYWDCFKRTDRRRTEIACVVWLIQVFCGGPLMGLSSYFYQKAGLPTDQAFNLSIGQFAMGLVGTLSSWFLLKKAGRRSIYLWGQVALCVLMITTGGLAFKSSSQSVSWAIGSMLLMFTFIYDLTVGPVCYCLVAEISSTRLRAKTIVLARNAYNIGGIIANVLSPRMLNSTEWNWGAKAGFFWAGTGALCLVWTYFRLPETMNRSYGALDILFEQKVSARKFASTEVDMFASHSQATHLSDEKAGSTEKVDVVANTSDLAYKYSA